MKNPLRAPKLKLHKVTLKALAKDRLDAVQGGWVSVLISMRCLFTRDGRGDCVYDPFL